MFERRAPDGVTYLGVAARLGGIVLLATYLPARRATQIDPIVALPARVAARGPVSRSGE